MSDLLLSQDLADSGDDVMRGKAPRLVDEDQSVHRSAGIGEPLLFAAGMAFFRSNDSIFRGTSLTKSSNRPKTVKPAAWMCPPPLKPSAMAAALAVPLERMLTRNVFLAISLKKRTISTPLIERARVVISSVSISLRCRDWRCFLNIVIV